MICEFLLLLKLRNLLIVNHLLKRIGLFGKIVFGLAFVQTKKLSLCHLFMI